MVPILDIGLKLIDKFIPDAGAKEKAQLELLKMQQEGALKQLDAEVRLIMAGAENVKADSQSEGWLASSWRPITMLTFTALIVARWLGIAVPDLTEAEYLKLWDIVQFGLGGYVVGRSAEKMVPQIVAAMGKK